MQLNSTKEVILFADDLLLLASFNNSTDRNSVQDAIDDISVKTRELEMSFNEGKCSAMVMAEGACRLLLTTL